MAFYMIGIRGRNRRLRNMKGTIALILALALLMVPALAYKPTIPTSAIDEISQQYVKDYGAYSFSRTAVDTGYQYTPQYAYSGMLFGADEGKEILGGVGYTAGVVANKITTDALTVDDDTGRLVDGAVDSQITRQYIQQGGSAYVTLAPGYDPETEEQTVVDMGFSKTDLAWISGDLDKFVVTPQSYAAVGGNNLEAVPKELSPDCKNAWLIERETQLPISIEAKGDSRLLDAYAGTASDANLVMTSEGAGGSNSEATMSGYAERFAGYTGAKVNAATDFVDENGNPVFVDNSVVMDFGKGDGKNPEDNTVENFWVTDLGVSFNAPDYEDFPATDDTTGPWPNQFISWPDDEYTNELI